MPTQFTATSSLSLQIILRSHCTLKNLLTAPHYTVMPFKALTVTKKAQLARESYEDIKSRAIKAYSAELLKSREKGARTVAKDFVDLYKAETGLDVKLDHLTLIRGANGGRSRAEANAAKSLLTDGEAEIVIGYIAELGNRGFPLSHRRLREHVNAILRARIGLSFQGVGKQWTHRFVEKHSGQIKMSWSSTLDTKRGRAVNENTIAAWFGLLKGTKDEFDIEKECTYGTDEIGVNSSEGRKERVMGSRKPGPQYQQRDGIRENITVIVTVCADGTTTPPAVIYKGQGYQVKWKQDNPANAS